MPPESLKYRRAVLKLSGEGFAPPGDDGLSVDRVQRLAAEVKRAADMGAQIAVVVGGGNLIRGATLHPEGQARVWADHMGMLATVINGLGLRTALLDAGVDAVVMNAFPISTIVQPFSAEACRARLDAGCVVLLTGGTGNPFFTTDTAAALRAVEIGADALLKATQVDGVYAADPRAHPDAERFDTLTYMDMLQKQLRVMDMTAASLCMDNALPTVVFDLNVDGNIEKAVRGERVGTLVQGA